MSASRPSRFRRWSLLLWKAAFAILLSAVVVMPVRLPAAEHLVQPGDDPQAAIDAAARGDKLTFLPGLHQHALGRHQAILYVEKPIHIELMAGATLKLADDVCDPAKVGEVTTDQDARPGKLDDLEVGGGFD